MVWHRVRLPACDGLPVASESLCRWAIKAPTQTHTLGISAQPAQTCIGIQCCIFVQFWTGGGDFTGLHSAAPTQTQKKVKLGHSNSSILFLFIKKLVLTNQYCVICTVNAQNLHYKCIVGQVILLFLQIPLDFCRKMWYNNTYI